MQHLKLRPYQENALDRIRDADARNLRRLLGVAATGLGKAQPVDEPVLTPTGWRPIGDLVVGDLVIGSDGKPTKITGVFPQGIRPCVAVQFSDGISVRCDPEHLWAVRDKHDVYRKRPWRIMRASELRQAEVGHWRVPMVEPIEFEPSPRPLPLDPYLLGLLLGDGGLSVTGRVLLHTEHELAATVELPSPCTMTKLRDDGPAKIAGTYILGGPTGRAANPVLSAIRELGLEGTNSHTKFVPPEYLTASVDDRLALLQGIMDADGHARPDGHVELCLVNRQLTRDVAALVRSLGGTARTAQKTTTWESSGVTRHGVAYPLSIAMTQCPFRWKASRWRPRQKYMPQRHVSRVVDAGEAECVCISVAAPDQLYVTTDYVLTHNTVIFTSLAQQRGTRTLILAHRDELIVQAAGKVLEVFGAMGTDIGASPACLAALKQAHHPVVQPRNGSVCPIRADGSGVGIVKASANDVHSRVVVASVQTLARQARLDKLLAATESEFALMGDTDPFGLVIVDEAHHAAADTYKHILKTLEAGEPHGPLLLGVTATPKRGDGVGLDDQFHTIVFNYDILWGIRAGYLSDVRGKSVKVQGLNTSSIKTTGGEYQAGDAGRVLENAGAPEAIAKAVKRYAKDRKTLVFTPTVAMAEHVAAEVVGQGMTAGWVSGETPMDDRRRVLRAFHDGEISVLANCAVLTEGYDEPAVDCVVIARPTKSQALYAQMIGRGTRKHPDKDHLLVLDVVGASADHSLITVPSLFGLGGKLRKKAETATAGVAELVAEFEQEEVRAGRLKAEDVELFKAIRSTGVAWIKVHSASAPLKRYERPMPQDPKSVKEIPKVVLAQRVPGEDVWTCGLQWRNGVKLPLIEHVTLEMAQAVGEDAVRSMSVNSAFTDTDAAWRKRKPSRRMLAAAKAWHVTVTDDMTMGDVSDIINERSARAEYAKQQRARRKALEAADTGG